MNPLVLAIVGPTASGKSGLALLLAQRLSGEIVSADSRQVYRYLDIGTAKPSSHDRKIVPHHFIDILDPSGDYSAGQFGEDAAKVIAGIFARGKYPIIVGGSGLYVKAAIDGMFEGPGRDAEVRATLEERMYAVGMESLVAELEKTDPVALETMTEITPRRVIRALEVYHSTGVPLSKLQQDRQRRPAFQTVQYGLQWERSALYRRIERRVDDMRVSGLVDEVKGIIGRGYDRNVNALNTVGYKEVFDFLEGRTDEPEMIDLIKRNTRRYAKRQLTWFRADKRIVWMPIDDEQEIPAIADTITSQILDAPK